jgi:hypothetical protein
MIGTWGRVRGWGEPRGVSQGGDRVTRGRGRGSDMIVRGKGLNSARERSLRERINMHVTGGKEARRGGMLVWKQKGASSNYPFERVSKGKPRRSPAVPLWEIAFLGTGAWAESQNLYLVYLR